MPLTQVGPAAFADLSLPEYKKSLKPWIAPGAKSAVVIDDAAETRKQSTESTPKPVPKRVVALGKTGLVWPEVWDVHPALLPPETINAEFRVLYDFAEKADRGLGSYSPEQRIKRAELGERINLLRPYVSRW